MLKKMVTIGALCLFVLSGCSSGGSSGGHDVLYVKGVWKLSGGSPNCPVSVTIAGNADAKMEFKQTDRTLSGTYAMEGNGVYAFTWENTKKTEAFKLWSDGEGKNGKKLVMEQKGSKKCTYNKDKEL